MPQYSRGAARRCRLFIGGCRGEDQAGEQEGYAPDRRGREPFVQEEHAEGAGGEGFGEREGGGGGDGYAREAGGEQQVRRRGGEEAQLGGGQGPAWLGEPGEERLFVPDREEEQADEIR